MAILQFNGTTISPDPSDMSVVIQDVSSADSGRAARTATMTKIVVARKRTIHLSWNNPTQAEARAIMTALRSGSNPVYCSVTYDGDPEASGTQTKNFYYGDISAAFQQCWVAGRKRYSKLSFDLIEV